MKTIILRKALFLCLTFSVNQISLSEQEMSDEWSVPFDASDLQKRGAYQLVDSVAIQNNDPHLKEKLNQYSLNTYNTFTRGDLVQDLRISNSRILI